MKGSTFGFWALSLSTVTVAACGNGSGSTFGDGGMDGGRGSDAHNGMDALTLRFDGSSHTDAGGKCTPLTCEKLKYNCGKAGDGCGKTLECGTCSDPETCGGGGKFSQCGNPASSCVAKTCKDLGFDCGPAGDGCGGVLNCGTCSGSDSCGGGGTPSVCGSGGGEGGTDEGGGACVPQGCGAQGIACGPGGDGCGGTLNCGACPTGQTCGGGGTPYQCGSQKACVPTTCKALGFNCGPAADGCGGALDCGDSCTGTDICGGGGQPGVCGNKPACTGLCLDQVTCDGGGTTSLTGQVVAGTLSKYGTPDPVPNVFVYVPNSTPQPFPPTLDCGCAPVTGDPVTSTTTDSNGMFTLNNVPVPASGSVPLVIQLGRWRRFTGLTFPVTKCASTAISAPITMPHNQSEGDIPRTAISTGNVDAMECVLLKMGVDQAEFTNPTGTGAIKMYFGNGSTIDTNTPAETALVPTTASTTVLDGYDQVIFPCWGVDPRATTKEKDGGVLPSANLKSATQQANVIDYTTNGGRVFGTHFSYSWLYNDTPFSGTATWIDDVQFDTGTATVENPGASEPDVSTFYQWINNVPTNAANAGTFTVISPRNDFSAINTNVSELWATTSVTTTVKKVTTTSTFPLIYTFQTPVPPPAATECGKVIYSDMHVSLPATVDGGTAGDTFGLPFPTECTAAPMSTQEKALEYLIWDLAACPAPPSTPQCVPATCKTLGYTCGPAGDGCGGLLDCGTCTGCEVCGGGGKPSVCGGSCCQPTSCSAQGLSCGPAGDGCGNTLNCGNCVEGQTCGGGGVSGKCGSSGTCTPETCTQEGFNCGPAGDGCGGLLACGTCPAGETCGGGGKSGVCGKPACVPQTCSSLGLNCGPAGDGCGGNLDCGTCPSGAVCGGGGTPGQCFTYTTPK